MTKIILPTRIDSSLDLQIQTTSVELDFFRVEFISSAGVKRLALLIKIHSRIQFSFTHCPTFMVEIFNSFNGIVNKSVTVKSFYAPYFCPVVKEERTVLLESSHLRGNRAPAIKHPTMDHYLHFNAREREFFAFVNTG